MNATLRREFRDSPAAYPIYVGEPKPIMCTLSAFELNDRAAAWRKLLGSGLVQRDRVPGGIRLRAEPGAQAALIALIDLERECCAWINYELTNDSVVTLTANGEGEAVLAGMFLPG
jgi:hypothetical protein